MVKFYRKNVSLSDLWVSSSEKFSDFSASSWQRGESPVPLLVIRLVLTGVALAILTWSLIEGATKYWPIFLTNWGVLLLAITMLSGLAVSLAALFNRSYVSEPKALPWYVSTYWMLFNITVTIAIMITALYWILLYNPEMREEFGVRFFWLDVSTHGITSVVIFCELVASRTPVRLLHVYQPLGFGLLYACFSAIYYAAGGTDALGNPFIYEVIDWRQPKQAGLVVGVSVVGLIALYVIAWSIALCRDKISITFIRSTGHDLPNAPLDQHMRIV